MNELAGRLGLKHTRFKNPHGLDQDGHVSSAYDMAIIGRALMRQPVLARIVGQRRHVVEGPPRWVFRTTQSAARRLRRRGRHQDRLSTTRPAAAWSPRPMRGGRRAIAVVMNSPRYGDDAASLLDYAFADATVGTGQAAETSRGRPGEGPDRDAPGRPRRRTGRAHRRASRGRAGSWQLTGRTGPRHDPRAPSEVSRPLRRRLAAGQRADHRWTAGCG